MSEKIEIRSANPDDYDTIIKLFDNNQDKEFAMRYYKFFFNDRHCCPHDEVLVKVVEGKIVGVIGYCPDRLETDDIYWLGWFYVHKDCRGHGYGRELLDYVIDILKNKPARKLYVDTSSFTSYEKAMGIYEKTGFAYEGTLKDYYEKGEDQIILGKHLDDNTNCKIVSQHTMNLHQLYRGYILSFNSLSIPIEKNIRNRPLFTHKIISYWSNVGLSLGFYPWSEESNRDLGWYSNGDKCILHLETENQHTRIKHTINKLVESDEEYKIAIIFAADDSFTEDDLNNEIRRINNGESLIITTWWKHESNPIKSGKHEQYCYPVTGHLIKGGAAYKLERATCIWDRYGTLRMSFEGEPNW